MSPTSPRPLVVVPARGGSKGIPDKNNRLLGDKPLVAYAIEQALAIAPPADIVVSTDSERTVEIARALGVPVPRMRPAHLATDDAAMRDVLLDALDDRERDNGRAYASLLLLQPTSPFRSVAHIREAVRRFGAGPAIDLVVSVSRSKASPYFTLFEEDASGYLKPCSERQVTRRQDAPTVYAYNGAIYVIATQTLRAKPMHSFERIAKYEMGRLASLDLDEPLDWILAEVVLARGLTD